MAEAALRYSMEEGRQAGLLNQHHDFIGELEETIVSLEGRLEEARYGRGEEEMQASAAGYRMQRSHASKLFGQ